MKLNPVKHRFEATIKGTYCKCFKHITIFFPSRNLCYPLANNSAAGRNY